jgi:N-dimethylarginine dimethylaminohydrolase
VSLAAPPVGVVSDVQAEFNARPAAILVHNPVASGSFRQFDWISDDSRLETEILFRARPNSTLYAEQHDKLVHTISAHVGRVIHLGDLIGNDLMVPSAASSPNQVFTRDSLITLPWLPGGYFRARLKPPQRRAEADVMQAAVERLGLREIIRLPEDIYLEGGDVIPFAYKGRRCLLVGFGPRSSPEAIDFLQQAFLPDFADELIAIRLAPWRMNLDGGFVPVAEDVIVSDTQSILAAERIDSTSREPLIIWEFVHDLKMHVIDTTRDESVYAQSCNCLCLGERNVVYYDLCPRVAELLEQHRIVVHRIPGSELIKGRGGPRCMTRPLYLPQP